MGWLSIIQAIFGFVSGPITEITKKIVDLRVEQTKALTDQEKIHADESIKVLETQRDVLLGQSEYNARVSNWVRVFFVLPVGVIVWKLMVWDLTIGSIMGCSGTSGRRDECGIYVTDKLDVYIWGIIMTVIGFYFVQNIARLVRRV